MAQKKCAIIGGGASGVITALSILKRGIPSVDLTMIDPGLEIGRGVAYRKSESGDLLNVPAQRMSAEIDNPSEFVNWLKSVHGLGDEFQYWPFVPRAIYGEYLHSKIQNHLGKDLAHLQAKVLGFSRKRNGFRLGLSTGESFEADFVILCTGYQSSASHVIARSGADPSAAAQRVLIVGSGLTAIDYWKQEKKAGTENFIFVSRHGLFPLGHLKNPVKRKLPILAGMTPRQVTLLIRAHQETGGFSWQDLADSIRLQANSIWHCWSPQERRQFIRHLKPYWQIIRHRVPEPIREELVSDLRTGKVRIAAGRFIDHRQDSSGSISVRILARGNAKPQNEVCELLLDARGAQIDQTLVSGKRAADRLWRVGPVAQAQAWESTAVPEIREQAARVAEALQASVAGEPSVVTEKRSLFERSHHFFAMAGKFADIFAGFFNLGTVTGAARDVSRVLTQRNKTAFLAEKRISQAEKIKSDPQKKAA